MGSLYNDIYVYIIIMIIIVIIVLINYYYTNNNSNNNIGIFHGNVMRIYGNILVYIGYI